jgi:hypothetical protein
MDRHARAARGRDGGRAGGPAGRGPRPAAAIAAAALLAAGLAGPAPAQDADALPVPSSGPAEARSRVLVEVGPGLLAPLANLAPGDTGAPGTAPEPAPSLSVAGSASANAVYLFSPKLGIGLHGTWSRPDVDLERVVGGAPSEDTRRLGDADFLAGTGELVYRPLAAPGGRSIDPFLAAGAGMRHLSFSASSLEDSTDPVVTVAGGARTALGGRFHWLLEVRGFFASTDPTGRGSRVQNDVLVTVGVGAGL